MMTPHVWTDMRPENETIYTRQLSTKWNSVHNRYIFLLHLEFEICI